MSMDAEASEIALRVGLAFCVLALASLPAISLGIAIGFLARRPMELLFAPLLAVTTSYPNMDLALYIGVAASVWAGVSYYAKNLLTS